MATQSGPAGAPLSGTPPQGSGQGLDRRVLLDAPHFEFFQAVRLLERMYPQRQTVGHHVEPSEEVVRFRSNPSLLFPASEIQGIEEERHAPHLSMTVNFMGLTGQLGVLPPHYSQLLLDRGTEKQVQSLRDFLDLFNHRLISLFYRAWEKYRFTVAYERMELRRRAPAREPDASPAVSPSPARQAVRPEEDRFSQNLFCLIGLGTPGLRDRLTIDDQILLYYAGLLAQRPRSAVALEGILQDYFGVPVSIVQFQGQWFEMNADLLTSLGEQGQNHQLGVSAVLWERIWDPPARFRVKVGPLTFKQFQDFMPGTAGYMRLVELTRFFVGEDMNFEVEPMLSREEVPYCRLGDRDGGGASAVRLGWSMWLKTREFEEDVPQPVFEARVAAA